MTDHRHLGEVITYLAQQQHGLAIWIAEDFSQAHLAAVDLLNRTSIEGDGYLLVRVRFTHAPDGYQVHFEVVSRPNSFVKNSGGADPPRVNPGKLEFWSGALNRIRKPFRASGLRNVRMRSHGFYLQVRVPASTGLRKVNGYLLFRVTTKLATAASTAGAHHQGARRCRGSGSSRGTAPYCQRTARSPDPAPRVRR